MKRLYLASSIDITAKDIANDIKLSLGKKPSRLKLAFIYTAAEPEGIDEEWLKKDRGGLVKSGFKIIDYTITGKSVKEIEKDLGGMDVVHVNGGNSFYLLLQARKSGFDDWIREKVLSGKKIYTGSSAGSIVAAPNIEIARYIETKEYEKKLRSYNSIGLVDFITLPHWGNVEFKSNYLEQRLDFAYKPENKIILLNDWQYVKVEGDIYKIVDIRD